MPAFLVGEAMGNYSGIPPFFDTVIAAQNNALHHWAIIKLSRSGIIDDVRNPPKIGCDPVYLLHAQVALLFAHFPS